MLGAVGKQNMVIFCGGLCFLKFVQVLPSRAEREVRAGSVLGAACKASLGLVATQP